MLIESKHLPLYILNYTTSNPNTMTINKLHILINFFHHLKELGIG